MIKYLLFIISFSVNAMSQAPPESDCTSAAWALPIEREDNSPLRKDEISGIRIYLNGEFYKELPGDTTRINWWATSITGWGCPKCVTGITVDTDNRWSTMSECLGAI